MTASWLSVCRDLVTCSRLQLTFHCFESPKNEKVIVIISHLTSHFFLHRNVSYDYISIYIRGARRFRNHAAKQRKAPASQTKPLVSRFPQIAVYIPCLIWKVLKTLKFCSSWHWKLSGFLFAPLLGHAQETRSTLKSQCSSHVKSTSNMFLRDCAHDCSISKTTERHLKISWWHWAKQWENLSSVPSTKQSKFKSTSMTCEEKGYAQIQMRLSSSETIPAKSVSLCCQKCKIQGIRWHVNEILSLQQRSESTRGRWWLTVSIPSITSGKGVWDFFLFSF